MKTSTRRLLAGATATALSVTGAVALGANASAAQEGVLLYGLTSADEVVQFRADGGSSTTRARIGTTALEDVVGIDVRPATGELYAVVNGPVTDRVVVIDPATGSVLRTVDLNQQLTGVNFGVDFNPVADRLRIVSDAEQNLRVDVTSGAVTADVRLAYAAGNPRTGDPSVRGAAYTSNQPPAPGGTTVLYDYDAAGNDAIVRQDPPNTGTLNDVQAAPGTIPTTTGGPASATSTAAVGFDIEARTDVGFVLVQESNGTRSLYRSNGPIGVAPVLYGTPVTGGVIDDLDDITVASARFSVADATGSEGGAAPVTVSRTGDATDTATVVLTPAAGSASTADFDATPRTVEFGAGVTTVTASFPLTADAVADAAETFTVTISSVTGGAGNAAATARAATVTITDVVPTPPSPSPSPTTAAPSPSATTAAPNPSPTTAPPTSSPSPQPTDPRPSLSPAPPGARRLGISTNRAFITPGVPSTITISGQPGVAAELYAYSRPSIQYRLVRSGTIPADGTLEFPILPGTNTRLFAAVAGQTGNESLSLVVNVRTAISLSVRRTGIRQYVFEGRLLPRNQSTLVSLYRVTPDGREVLTAQARSNPAADGLYRITRRFSGSGSFFFVVRTSQTLINAPGLSNVRSVAIR